MKMFFNFLLHNVYGPIANRQYGDIHKEGQTKTLRKQKEIIKIHTYSIKLKSLHFMTECLTYP
jgi:hypothetical protein